MDRNELRRHNLARLIDERYDGHQKSFADAIERAPDYISRLLKGVKNLGEALADDIVAKLQLPTGYFDRPVERAADDNRPGEHSIRETRATYQLPRRGIPVVGHAQLGADGYWREMDYPTGWGDGYVRWDSLDPNAYALRVFGDSMRPRIKPGEFVVMEPGHEPMSGDEVLVRTLDGQSMVKVLNWRRGGMTELGSVNEDHRPITLDDSQIAVIHYVAVIAKSALRLPGE